MIYFNKMKAEEILSIIGEVGLVVILFAALYFGVIGMTDVSAAIAYGLVAAMIALPLWGFRKRIERAFSNKPDSDAEKLTKTQNELRKEEDRLKIFNEKL